MDSLHYGILWGRIGQKKQGKFLKLNDFTKSLNMSDFRNDGELEKIWAKFCQITYFEPHFNFHKYTNIALNVMKEEQFMF